VRAHRVRARRRPQRRVQGNVRDLDDVPWRHETVLGCSGNDPRGLLRACHLADELAVGGLGSGEACLVLGEFQAALGQERMTGDHHEQAPGSDHQCDPAQQLRRRGRSPEPAARSFEDPERRTAGALSFSSRITPLGGHGSPGGSSRRAPSSRCCRRHDQSGPREETTRSIARSRALEARGLRAISAALGFFAPRNNSRWTDRAPHTQGSPGGH